MTTPAEAAPPAEGFSAVVRVMLNTGHSIDHMFLLIFATALASIRLSGDQHLP
jgi:hypothetical protein